jgi:hypothetical protein
MPLRLARVLVVDPSVGRKEEKVTTVATAERWLTAREQDPNKYEVGWVMLALVHTY